MLNDPQRRFAPRARLDILGNKDYAIACLLELLRTLLTLRLDTHDFVTWEHLYAHTFLSSPYSRTILTYVTFAIKVMAEYINMTQAQLTALINEQVVAALAAAQAGGIPCSRNWH